MGNPLRGQTTNANSIDYSNNISGNKKSHSSDGKRIMVGATNHEKEKTDCWALE